MSSNSNYQQYPHHNGGDNGMTAPSSHPYAQRSTHTEASAAPLEDCRDYLRTGRCKYGASCKYNHPPNVQSGGGMKAPIDPSEPLFPIRPNEPICQYFVKHGTCKFGQACKFHHPPQMAGTSPMMNSSNNAVLVSVPIGRKPDAIQGLWASAGGNDSGVQILPQRPDEQNCIYFLKNGRCKYGATCRYHHPLNFHDRSGGTGYEENGRSRHTFVQELHRGGGGPKVHYVTSLPPGAVQQGHFVVADGAVTFVTLDGATPAHVVSIPHSAGNGKEGQLLYSNAPGTVTSSSSSTSIASSYETAVSNLEGQDSSSSLWNRKHLPSNGANGYNLSSDASAQGRSHVQGNRTMIVQNIGEGGALSLPRVVSTGSASDGTTIFFDANGHSQPAWRSSRSSSFDQTRSRGASFHSQSDEMQRSMSVQSALDDAGRPRTHSSNSPMLHSRSQRSMRNQRQPGEVDDGLSQMTSALLTMLDTPEEAAAHQAGYDIDEDDEQLALTPRMGTRYASRPANNTNDPPSGNTNEYMPHQPSIHYSQHQQSYSHLPPPTYLKSHEHESEGQRYSEHTPSWLPSWHDSSIAGDLHDNSQSLNSIPQSQSSNSPHHNSSHVGLYLP